MGYMPCKHLRYWEQMWKTHWFFPSNTLQIVVVCPYLCQLTVRLEKIRKYGQNKQQIATYCNPCPKHLCTRIKSSTAKSCGNDRTSSLYLFKKIEAFSSEISVQSCWLAQSQHKSSLINPSCWWKPQIIQVRERLAQRETKGLGRYKIGLPRGLPFVADQFVSPHRLLCMSSVKKHRHSRALEAGVSVAFITETAMSFIPWL